MCYRGADLLVQVVVDGGGQARGLVQRVRQLADGAAVTVHQQRLTQEVLI